VFANFTFEDVKCGLFESCSNRLDDDKLLKTLHLGNKLN